MLHATIIDERLEIFRDAVRQIAVHGETVAMRDAAEAVLDHHKVASIRSLFAAAEGSAYLQKLTAAWGDMR